MMAPLVRQTAPAFALKALTELMVIESPSGSESVASRLVTAMESDWSWVAIAVWRAATGG